MATRTRYVDMGGLTPIVDGIRVGATKPGQLGTELTGTEIALLDGLTPGTVTASKATVVDSAGVLDNLGVTLLRSPAATVGTAGTNVVAQEHGDGVFHYTKLTCTAFAVGTGGDAEDLTIGGLVYTFPAGALMISDGSVKGVFDQASHGSISDGEVALGTVVGAGAEDTVETVGGEDLMVAQAISSVTLGTTVVTVGGLAATAPKIIASGASPRTCYLNLAATWPNIAAPEAVTFTGVITLRWRIIS